jgi:hypothetical protein
MRSHTAHYGLTAGHVLEEGGPLHVLRTDHAYNGASFVVEHLGLNPRSLQDRYTSEVGIVRIHANNATDLNATIPRINCAIYTSMLATNPQAAPSHLELPLNRPSRGFRLMQSLIEGK